MRIERILCLAVFFVLVAASGSFSAGKSDWVMGFGGGLYAGISGFSGEVLLHAPSAQFGTNNMYLRVALALTDSHNLPSGAPWRRVMPIYADGVYYFSDYAYAGAGLNFPLKVSDDFTGQVGGQYFVGTDLKVDYLGRIWGELGYGTLNISNSNSFAGIYMLFGLRYDLI